VKWEIEFDQHFILGNLTLGVL